MRSRAAIRWTLLGMLLTALVALPLYALDRATAAAAVLQLGMLLALLTGLAVDRRATGGPAPEEDDRSR